MITTKKLMLTKREKEIINLVAEDYSSKEIASILFLSTHTIHTHKKNMITKLNKNSFYGVLSFAYRNNIISMNTDELPQVQWNLISKVS